MISSIHSFFKHQTFTHDPVFITSLCKITFTISLCAQAIGSLLSPVSLYSAIIALLCLMIFSLFSRQKKIIWIEILPATIVLFIVWCAASLTWSSYNIQTLFGVFEQLFFLFFAIYMYLMRDFFQIIRILGDTLQFIFTLSLTLEFLSAFVFKTDLAVINIHQAFLSSQLLQGLFESPSLMAISAIILAIVAFIERKARSISSFTFSSSLAVSLIGFTFSSSVLTFVLASVIAATFLLLMLTRKLLFRHSLYVRGAFVSLFLLTSFLIIPGQNILNNLYPTSEKISNYLNVWRYSSYLHANEVFLGWGWVGQWPDNIFPFSLIRNAAGVPLINAKSAYADTLLQIGSLGFLLFIALLGITLLRSWLLATIRKSLVYIFAPLLMVLFITASIFESFTLVSFGWLMLCLCALQTRKSHIWRTLPLK